jgi:hypothetical protein
MELSHAKEVYPDQPPGSSPRSDQKDGRKEAPTVDCPEEMSGGIKKGDWLAGLCRVSTKGGSRTLKGRRKGKLWICRGPRKVTHGYPRFQEKR